MIRYRHLRKEITKMYDYLFVFTEESDNEGEDFLVECESLEKAKTILNK